MNKGEDPREPAALFRRYLETLPLPDRELTSADVEAGQRARQALLDLGAAAVPALVAELTAADFVAKDAAYDLILELGQQAREPLRRAVGTHGPVVDIWIATALRRLGASDELERIWPLLEHGEGYVRHLAALALAFQIENAQAHKTRLMPMLLEALDDERSIESTPFTIAGSALAMISAMARQSFTAPPRDAYLYNYDDFAYPPPVHPFPFAADLLTQAGDEEKRAIKERARAWWRNTP
ncbi:MAG: hypothetical protein H3C34_24860 [Caldilineaceae bacterium]|nr:hypothetical protein [Caldilineaceae bacterium]